MVTWRFFSWYIYSEWVDMVCNLRNHQNSLCLFKMANKMQLQLKRPDQGYVFLGDLEPGSGGPIMVMINRKWDVYNVKGTYMSTDFIISDQQRNAMHCVASHNRAHKFLEMVKEGSVYVLSGFKVQPNRKDFQIIQDSPYMLEFNGSTYAKKAVGDVNNFVRYCFQITAFEELVPVDNKYLVDVVGYALYLGTPKTKANGSKTLEFLLTNESGRQVPVTLWGRLGEEMIKKRGAGSLPYCCILTGMSVKKYYGELGLSSTSSTQIINSPDVPSLKSFISAISEQDLSQMPLEKVDNLTMIDTLADLMNWGREWKDGMHLDDGRVVFKSTVEIVDIRTRNGWYLITCSSGRCRKGLARVIGGFWCEGCKSSVLYPHIRFKIQMEVRDESMTAVVTLFDEPAEQLIKRTAKSLMEEEQQNDWGDDVLPPVLWNLIGTRHVFEIKGHTYYNSGEFEGFNCNQVVSPVIDIPNLAIVVKDNDSVAPTDGSSTSKPDIPDPVPTPAKKERKKRKLVSKNSESKSVGVQNSAVNIVSVNEKGDKRVTADASLETDNNNDESPYVDLLDIVSESGETLRQIGVKKKFSVESGSDIENDVDQESLIKD